MKSFLSRESQLKTSSRPDTLELATSLRREEYRMRGHGAIRAIGNVAIGALLFGAVDTEAGLMEWHNDTSSLVAVSPAENSQQASSKTIDHDDTNDDAALFVFGGFGVSNERLNNIGKAFDKAIGGVEPVVAVNQADTGIDIDQITESLRQYIKDKNIAKVDIGTHSMGFMLGVQVGAKLEEAGITVRSVTADCPPAGLQNVRGSDRGGTKLLQKMNDLDLHFGPGTRVGIEAARIILKDPQSIANISTFKTAVHRAKVNAPNPVMMEQADIVRSFHLLDYKDSFPVTTKFTQLAPKDNSRDHTVNDTQAFIDLQHGLGRPINQKLLEDTGHASIDSDPVPYGKALKEVWATFNDTAPNNNHFTVKPPQTSGEVLAAKS